MRIFGDRLGWSSFLLSLFANDFSMDFVFLHSAHTTTVNPACGLPKKEIDVFIRHIGHLRPRILYFDKTTSFYATNIANQISAGQTNFYLHCTEIGGVLPLIGQNASELGVSSRLIC